VCKTHLLETVVLVQLSRVVCGLHQGNARLELQSGQVAIGQLQFLVEQSGGFLDLQVGKEKSFSKIEPLFVGVLLLLPFPRAG